MILTQLFFFVRLRHDSNTAFSSDALVTTLIPGTAFHSDVLAMTLIQVFVRTSLP